MYLGKMMEYAATEALFADPLHPYTRALFSAIPVPDPDYQGKRIILEGSIPSPADPPKGCRFHTRCPHVMDICTEDEPVWQEVQPGHFCACHLYRKNSRHT